MRSLIVKHRQQSRAVYARILTAANKRLENSVEEWL